MRNAWSRRGISRKIGIVDLKVKALLEGSVAAAVTVETMSESTLIKVLTVLLGASILINDLFKALHKSLTENNVFVLYSLWRILDANMMPDHQDLKSALNRHMDKYQLTKLTQKDVVFPLNTLKKLKRTEKTGSLWRLAEKLRIEI